MATFSPTVLGSFALMALILLSTANAAAPRTAFVLDAKFEKYDLNRDGFLDAAELAQAFRGSNAKAKAHPSPDQKFVIDFDLNGDGKISPSEFDAYEQKAVAAARAASRNTSNYSPTQRKVYRSPQRHHSARSPYQSRLRYVQRAYQKQRQAYSYSRSHRNYTPAARGGYRGVAKHHHGRRR